MAAEYRFLNAVNNVDVTLITDAGPDNVSFFVTDLKGYDTQDIIQGIDVDIQEYDENYLIQLAMDKSLALYRLDKRGEACLVLPGVQAGKFNGLTSYLSVANIDFSNGSGDINTNIRTLITFRLKMQDIVNLSNEFYLIGSSDNNNVMTFRFLNVQPAPDNSYFTASFFPSIAGNGWSYGVGKIGFPVQVFADTCYTYDVHMNRTGLDLLFNFIINQGEELQGFSRAGTVPALDSTTVYFGATGNNAVPFNFFRGIMRNLMVAVNDVEVINIADPSNGTNTGTGPDGVPTDIESISVLS